MTLHRLENRYVEQLKGLYDTQQQLLRTYPMVATRASRAEAVSVLKDHVQQTQAQVHWLEQFIRILQHQHHKPRLERFRTRAASELWDELYF